VLGRVAVEDAQLRPGVEERRQRRGDGLPGEELHADPPARDRAEVVERRRVRERDVVRQDASGGRLPAAALR